MNGSELHAQLVAARVADLRHEAAERALVRDARATRTWARSSWRALVARRTGAPVVATAAVPVSVPACC